MNKYLTTGAALVAAVVVGVLIGRSWQPGAESTGPGSQSGEREILYWKAPMDPNYRRDEPGKSPMGMDLVPVYADEAGEEDPAVVTIDPTIVNNLGVRTATAERGALSRRVETVGYVSYDEDTLQHIHTRVDGWIERLAVKATGDPIEKGQLLFELYSPTLVNAQEEYLAARSSGNARLLQASRERLESLGVRANEIGRLDRERSVRRLVSVFAGKDGYAAHLGVREGIYVTPAMEIMSIAEFDQVWVLAEVFERQAAWISVGQQAEVELDYLPGRTWQGSVDYVYPELDQKTRTLKVRLRFENAEQVLRPNMFARIRIFGEETGPVVHIPRQALIRGGAVNRVVMDLGDGRYRAQPVVVGIESGNRVEIRSGIRAGERVVTSGQFLIDSESNIESAMARMTPEDSQDSSERVRIRAIVRGTDAGAATARLQHDPVPEWSWPAMTMNFQVADTSMLDGLTSGQAVEITVEKQAEGGYRIVAIQTLAEAAPEDHSGHDSEGGDDASEDHSGHDMENM